MDHFQCVTICDTGVANNIQMPHRMLFCQAYYYFLVYASGAQSHALLCCDWLVHLTASVLVDWLQGVSTAVENVAYF